MASRSALDLGQGAGLRLLAPEQPVFDCLDQFLGGGVAVSGLSRHGLEADGLQRRGTPGSTAARGRKAALADALQDRLGIASGEGYLARQQVVEGGAQAVDVAGWPQFVDRPAACSGGM